VPVVGVGEKFHPEPGGAPARLSATAPVKSGLRVIVTV
jgi:hypothetical protein